MSKFLRQIHLLEHNRRCVHYQALSRNQNQNLFPRYRKILLLYITFTFTVDSLYFHLRGIWWSWTLSAMYSLERCTSMSLFYFFDIVSNMIQIHLFVCQLWCKSSKSNIPIKIDPTSFLHTIQVKHC